MNPLLCITIIDVSAPVLSQHEIVRYWQSKEVQTSNECSGPLGLVTELTVLNGSAFGMRLTTWSSFGRAWLVNKGMWTDRVVNTRVGFWMEFCDFSQTCWSSGGSCSMLFLKQGYIQGFGVTFGMLIWIWICMNYFVQFNAAKIYLLFFFMNFSVMGYSSPW